MKIYDLNVFFDHSGSGKYNRESRYDKEYDLRKVFSNFSKYEDTEGFGRYLDTLFCYCLLKEYPNLYKDIELLPYDLGEDYRLDFEKTFYTGIYLSSEKFKNFCEKEGINFSFFPTISDGEVRYLTFLESLPCIFKSEMTARFDEFEINQPYFRDDVVKYKGNHLFTGTFSTYLYVTEEMREKFEEEGFKFNYYEEEVDEIEYDKENVEKFLESVKDGIEKEQNNVEKNIEDTMTYIKKAKELYEKYGFKGLTGEAGE